MEIELGQNWDMLHVMCLYKETLGCTWGYGSHAGGAGGGGNSAGVAGGGSGAAWDLLVDWLCPGGG